jgi:hypothetical protein
MHVGSLLTCRPRFSQVGLGAVHTRHDPHPLGNNDSFQGSVDVSYVMTFSSPKVSDLSRHERGLVPAYLSPSRIAEVTNWKRH